MNHSESEYNKRIEQYQIHSGKLASRLNRISNLRLLTAVAGFGAAGYLLFRKEELLSAAFFLPALILFLCLVIRHDRLKKEKARIDILGKINEDSLKRRMDGF